MERRARAAAGERETAAATSRPPFSARRSPLRSFYNPNDSFVKRNRPLNPNGEIALYGKIPKFESPPFAVAGSPGFEFRSG
jgi:hypothetical protein